jgi:hypothetical protein
MFRKEICMPILGLVLISLGGFLLHLRIHPPTQDALDLIPVVFGVLSIVALPFLFNSPRTVAVAYLLNAVTVVADILILLAKLPIAHVILRHFRPKNKL